MANLKEQSKWEEGIYQIEENDPVVGGEDGISNKQAKQLANRTAYLRQELEKPATTEQVGRTQLADNLTTNDNTKALTAKQGLTLKGFIDSLTRSLGNYIPNSKKSNAVNSSSSDTVATSAAAKTAYDKGVSAYNLANSKQSPATTLAGYGILDFKVAALNNEDLDAVNTNGIYYQPSSSKATTNNHYPVTRAGALEVLYNGSIQKYLDIHTRDYYVRAKIANKWTDWQILGGSDCVKRNGDSMDGELKNKVAITPRKIKSLSESDGGNGYLDMWAEKAHVFYGGSDNTQIARLYPKFINFKAPLDFGNTMLCSNIDLSNTNDDATRSTNADGIWHDDGSNTWYFQSDRPYKSTTDLRSTVKAKEFETENGKKLSEVITIDDLVGIPIPYPKTSVPSGYLAMNGQRFSTSRYPKLAKLYPTGQLPDLRGEFIRGWDNGRNVDRGRGILSSQNDAFQNHFHYLPTGNGDNEKFDNGIQHIIKDNTSMAQPGAWEDVNNEPSDQRGNNVAIKNGGYTRTYPVTTSYYDATPRDNRFNLQSPRLSYETRPRNVAFQYICLAG